MESIARDKHSSLLRTFVNYGRKKFYNVGRAEGDGGDVRKLQIRPPKSDAAAETGRGADAGLKNVFFFVVGEAIKCLFIASMFR